jgi:hypothetical protein
MFFLAIFSLLCLPVAAQIQTRGTANWPTRNQQRIEVKRATAKGAPVWLDAKLPEQLNPDSIRAETEYSCTHFGRADQLVVDGGHAVSRVL